MFSENVIKVNVRHAQRPAAKIDKEARYAMTESTEILSRARARAAEVIAEAETAKAAVFAEHEERGYAAGLEQWNTALAEAWKLREEYLLRNELELVKLAVAVAAQVAAETAQADPAVVLGTVRKAVQTLVGSNSVTLKVHPSEEECVRRDLSEKTEWEAARVIVVGSDAVEAGGCIVESEVGIVDARLSTQMAAVEKLLVRRAHASGS